MGKSWGLLRAATGFLLIGAVVTVSSSVSTAAPPSGPSYACTTAAKPGFLPTKIMIAGDSVTNASAGDYTWRYWLWHDLVDHGAKVDFVGKFNDTLTPGTVTRGNHQYADCDFDQDHESRGGVKIYSNRVPYSYTTPTPASGDPTLPYYPGYSSWIRGAVATYKPSILVAFVGANDVAYMASEFPGQLLSTPQLADKAIGFLKNFITQARLGNPGVDIVLTTVPTPGTPGATTRYTLYNKALPGVVSQMSTSSSKLTIATMPSWVNHTWDGVHPDAVGEVAIAATVADALHQLSPSLPGRPSPLQKPAIGPRVAATISAASAGSSKVALSWTLPPGGDRTIVYARNVTGNGPWVQQADLVLTTLRQYYPTVGTATCQAPTPCKGFTVSGLSGGTTYEFKVRSGKGLAVAADLTSNVVTVAAAGPLGRVVPLAPVAGVRKVTVRWTDLGGTTGYDVRWRVAGKKWAGPATAASRSRLISGLKAGTKFGFQVRARHGATAGPWSTEVFAKPKAR